MKKSFKKIKLKSRKTIIVVISLVLAFTTYTVIINRAKKNNEVKKIKVISVTEKIAEDTKIDNYVVKEIAAEDGSDVKYATEEDLEGKVSTAKLFKGDYITLDKIKQEESSDQMDKVLYSLKLEPSDAVAGTLRAGDDVYVAASLVSGSSEISSFIFENSPGVPQAIRINSVYDADLNKVVDGDKVASTYLLELKPEQVPILRGAELVQKIKLTTAR